MRLAVLLSLGLVLGGCVPTADFVALRDEVRQLQAEKRKMKETETEPRKRPEEPDRAQKSSEALMKKLDALEAKVEALRIRQQGFDQKLGELLRRMDEGGPRDEEAPAPRAKAPGQGFDAPAILTPTASYNQAYNDYLKGNYDLAVAGFEDFLKRFPGTSLTAHAQHWIGESHFNKRDYPRAIEAYERVIANYPKSDKVPAALAKAGLAYAEQGNADKARGLFKRVVEDYPQSPEAALAKRRLAELR